MSATIKKILSFILVLSILAGLGVFAGATEIQMTSVEYNWPLPLRYNNVVSEFGYRIHPVTGEYKRHSGIDIDAPSGVDIYAAADGTVITANSDPYSSGWGKYVLISHNDGNYTLYAHASEVIAKKGETVSQGDVIALVGDTGMTTGPHLHFEFYEGKYSTDNLVDPLTYLPSVLIAPIVDLTIPKEGTTIGKGQPLDICGTVYANGATTTVTGEIKDSSGSVLQSKTVCEIEKQLDLKYSAINNSLIFGKLSVGKYTLTITATNSEGSDSMSVTVNVSSVIKAPTVELTSPSDNKTITEGQPLDICGTVFANGATATVTGEIKDSSGNIVQSHTVDKVAASLDLKSSAINNNLLFGKLKAGVYTLTVTASNSKGSDSDSVKITVKASLSSTAKPKVISVKIDDIRISPKLDSFISGNVKTIIPVIDAEDGASYTVSWHSDNPSLASVDSNGTVTAGTETGSVTVTCTVTDSEGNSVSDTCVVNVNCTWLEWLLSILFQIVSDLINF